MLLYALLACTFTDPPPVAVVPPAPTQTLRERFGDLPFLVPIDAPATVALVAGGSVPASDHACGACHADNHAEWAQATHASAIHDLQFLAELQKPGQPRWLCLNCHAPTKPQRAETFSLDTHLVDGILRVASTPNPTFDPRRAAEGVGCATCHVRRDADGEGLVVGPRGSGRAPHRVRADREALTGICVNCHSPTSPDGPIVISPTFVCWFETAAEFAPPAPSKDNRTGCAECHMPRAKRAAATDGPPLDVARHAWTGGGVPKSYAGYDSLLERGWESGLDVVVNGREVTLINTRSGHALPTADPERFLRVEARLERGGVVVARDVLRLGQTWDWGDATTGRPAKRLADTRLRGGETRTWSPTLAGEGDLVVEVAQVRLTPENAAGMRAAQLDAELSALWPEAQGLLAEIDQHYPLATWVFRERQGRSPRTWTQAELLAESKAFGELPLEQKRSRLEIPASGQAAP